MNTVRDWKKKKKKLMKREEKLKRMTKQERNGRRGKWVEAFLDPKKLLAT